ncbi:MAG: bifunctional demethylmenaquinone methyltransferase/2-methoxy-6-polyprenyl-1,4-benzoquinol methylase UbiE [Crocinitomicaceae bacterium]|jgi:demethylmenaquinone methyltransferase / 2-methoxy-6-polyprenyl-1,4-benzoquinol methylase|nr:bifunctional demethylmenaquinone methyltransferase/2-methoxy-6-polyprenyl-1,4-benzoquinol methylase UbiE [Crocinitomicaceae bacterium]MBT6513681.1 bifunctional demethylmenaquinone methyltransferase/2-methoxy-6-polyprenyl-1,4-benzoquinol methylase UbiE [Crocinitomicaceae bacterium]MDG2332277.1 bifunctional demethylmenaquinone methyltransferase/2-methoxy-6-polyprenyl-1,4-benzoquinol methylase UbiE [Flavobacteriales bacterium]
MGTKVTPYEDDNASKKEQVAEMFDNISGKYDFLNHFLSAGIDKRWRKKAIKMLEPHGPKEILDLATGTADFAIAALKLNPNHITGVDISEGMLAQGRLKLTKKKFDDKITLQYGDSENLPFEDNTFDALTVGFGVRNYEHLENGLAEMLRVLKPNGVVVILEFSKPKNFPAKQFFSFYNNRLLPLIGKTVSKDPRAYTYLPESIAAFPEGEDFIGILKKVGYLRCEQKKVSGGVASIYIGQK